jgi:hypothetical protein
MNNTPIEKIYLKCIVTGEVIYYKGWDYISKRIEKAGSLELLHKNFMSRKGAKLAKLAKLSNGNSAILTVKTMDTPGTVKKPRKTKQESVDSFVMPGSKKAKGSIQMFGYEARLVDGKYILSKDGVEYTQFPENSNKNKAVVDSQ